MAEEWQVVQAIRLVKIAKFLTARADERGMTHGEKHHLHEVIGMLLSEALTCFGADISPLERNLDKDAPSDIPF